MARFLFAHSLQLFGDNYEVIATKPWNIPCYHLQSLIKIQIHLSTYTGTKKHNIKDSINYLDFMCSGLLQNYQN